MKIGEITGRQSIEKGVGIPSEAPSVKPGEFQSLLDEELNPGVVSDEKSCCAGGSVAAVGALSPVVKDVDVSALPGADMNQMSAAVGDALNRIADAVGDKDLDLKKVERVISSLSEDADALQERLSTLPKSHALRQIADELQILAHVESLKWKRGDYL